MLSVRSRIKSRHGELLVSQWIFGVCHLEKICYIFRPKCCFCLVHKNSYILSPRHLFDCSNFFCLSSFRALSFDNNWKEKRSWVVLNRSINLISRNVCVTYWVNGRLLDDFRWIRLQTTHNVEKIKISEKNLAFWS